MMVMTMMMMVIPWKHTCHDDEDDILRRLHIPVIMTNIISLYCVYTRLAMAPILQVFIMSVYSSNIGSTTSSFIKILNISSSRKNWEHNVALSIQIVSLFSPPNCALFTF